MKLRFDKWNAVKSIAELIPQVPRSGSTFRLYHTFSEKNNYAVSRGTTDNLMDYNDGKELHKYQWDLIKDPQGEAFAIFMDEEEVAMTNEFIDSKHTLLFDHVYDHNKIGNLEYAEQVENNSGKESIVLDYSDDESDSWTDEQKQWIDKWDVGTYDGDEISESIIEKIQNADDGETIESITLEKNRLYIGKYTVDGGEYPVAIYSKKDELDNLKKVKDNDLNYIIEEEKNHYIYYDENFADYFIIAFYEEGDAKPSLIIQVEQIGNIYLENSMKKWLEYLGILKEENELLFEMYCSDSIIEQNEYVTISDNPGMPDLEVKNTSDKQIQFRLKIEYRRDIREDETYFPNGEWETVEERKTWDIDFGNKIRGGKATLQYKINGKTEEYIFYIRGKNPTEQEIKQYITEQGYDNDIWFLTRLIRQESSFLHFNSGTDYGPKWEDYQGCPNHGSPHGWGLMQLDLLEGGQRPTAQELWDWKANIDRGVDFLLNEKHSAVENHFADDTNAVSEWNHYNPEDRIEGAGSQTEGDITYTHSNSNNFDIDFGGEPSQNKKSFIDATWIKHYNGSSGGTDGYPGYYYILKQVGDHKPYWDIQRTNSNGHNYVGAVSNQNP